jgi:putative membrane protein
MYDLADLRGSLNISEVTRIFEGGATKMGLGMGFGLLLMILFWGGLIALAVWLVRALFPHTGRPPALAAGRDVSAHEILDRRYARGEISREQYDLMKESISKEIG